MFRRTTLLGSCILLPVVTNIILVDIFYSIDLGALLVALFIEAVLIIILALHKEELLEVFWRKQDGLFASGSSAKLKSYGTNALRVLMILIPAIFTYWVANYNNRFPTPIDGAWTLVETSPNDESTRNALTAIFFERNRAYLCVFKRQDGTYEWHHFEIDSSKGTIRMWDHWLQKGPQIFDGIYEISDDRLRLRGKFANSSTESLLVLRRRG